MRHAVLSIVLVAASALQPSHGKDRPGTVCDKVVEAANGGKLNLLTVPRAEVDFDGDGKKETITIDVQGTMHAGSLSITRTNGEIIDAEVGGENEWLPDLTLLEVKQHYYVLAADGDKFAFLARLDAGRGLERTCEFTQTYQRQLVTNHDEEICRAAVSQDAMAIPFDTATHSLTRGRVGRPDTGPSDLAALTDIDNDGKEDVVVQLELASGAGRGCDSKFLAVLNATRDRIANRPLNDVLTQPAGCGGALVPVSIHGHTYLDLDNGEETRQILRADGDKVTTLCEWRRHIVHGTR